MNAIAATATALALGSICCSAANAQAASAQPSPSSGQGSTDLELVSGHNRLRIEQATGRISFLSAGEHTLLAGARGRGPFRLHLPLPDFEAHMIEAHETRPSVEASG